MVQIPKWEGEGKRRKDLEGYLCSGKEKGGCTKSNKAQKTIMDSMRK